MAHRFKNTNIYVKKITPFVDWRISLGPGRLGQQKFILSSLFSFQWAFYTLICYFHSD